MEALVQSFQQILCHNNIPRKDRYSNQDRRTYAPHNTGERPRQSTHTFTHNWLTQPPVDRPGPPHNHQSTPGRPTVNTRRVIGSSHPPPHFLPQCTSTPREVRRYNITSPPTVKAARYQDTSTSTLVPTTAANIYTTSAVVHERPSIADLVLQCQCQEQCTRYKRAADDIYMCTSYNTSPWRVRKPREKGCNSTVLVPIVAVHNKTTRRRHKGQGTRAHPSICIIFFNLLLECHYCACYLLFTNKKIVHLAALRAKLA